MFLGLVFAILTGISWVAVGAVIGLAEKRGCGTARQQLVGQTITGTITATVLALGVAFRPNAPAFSLRADLAPMLWTALWGFLNYWMALFGVTRHHYVLSDIFFVRKIWNSSFPCFNKRLRVSYSSAHL